MARWACGQRKLLLSLTAPHPPFGSAAAPGVGYRDGGLGVAKDSLWAGAPRCPGSIHPIPGHGPHLWAGAHSVVWTLLPGALGVAQGCGEAGGPRKWLGLPGPAGCALWAESSNRGSGAGRGRGPLTEKETEARGW